MGISIEPGKITLECDVATAMFCHGVMEYQHPDGFIGMHIGAMKDGWLERQTGKGRIWLCPECSGK